VLIVPHFATRLMFRTVVMIKEKKMNQRKAVVA
jgi:hypothetical protein